MKITVTLTGQKDMLQHNSRLANPTDDYKKALANVTSKRKKTEEDYMRIMHLEARGSCWESDDEMMAVPTSAVWSSIRDGARMFKLGKHVEKALSFDDECQPLLIDGAEIKCDDFLEDATAILYKSVKVSNKRVMRSRPRIPAGWQTSHAFTLLPDVLDVEDLIKAIEAAGRLVGIGDWRPVYGTYSAEVTA